MIELFNVILFNKNKKVIEGGDHKIDFKIFSPKGGLVFIQMNTAWAWYDNPSIEDEGLMI